MQRCWQHLLVILTVIYLHVVLHVKFQCFEGTLLLWGWKQQIASKPWKLFTRPYVAKDRNPVTFRRVTQLIHTCCWATCWLQLEYRLGDLVWGTERGIANCPHLPLILPTGPQPCCQVEPRSRVASIPNSKPAAVSCWEITWNGIGCPEDGGSLSIRNVARVGLGLFTGQAVWNWDRRTSLPHAGTHRRRYNLSTWQRRQTDTTVLQVMAVHNLTQSSHCVQRNRQNNAKFSVQHNIQFHAQIQVTCFGFYWSVHHQAW
jgi:hypothetical protein